MSRRDFHLIALAALTVAISVGGCQRDSAAPAATVPEATPVVQLVKQQGLEMLQFNAHDIPGLKMVDVQNIELPGVLETTGQITFDDRSVSTIVSRVQGRIEQTRVSLWDNVRRGEPIVALYSPDFMTAEAEYLQAHDDREADRGAGVGGGVRSRRRRWSMAAKRKLELLGMETRTSRRSRRPNPSIWMRAPISGTVVDNKAVRGAAVNPGDVLLLSSARSTTSGLPAIIYRRGPRARAASARS